VGLKSKNDTWQYVLLFVFVLISRLPFLSSGYGIDGDCWAVANTAKILSTTGEYTVSRFPGYPVHEILCSLVSDGDYFGLNFISALFSAVATLFFALILRVLRFRYIFLAAVTFSMVPIFYISSTTTIDYVVALGFVMMSMYFLLRDRILMAGIFLGLAIGSRITSGAMLLPFSILLVEDFGLRNNLKRILKLTIATCITGMILFIPVVKAYGFDFFTYYNIPYPSVAKVLFKFFIETWGVVGALGLIISTGLLFLPDKITAKKFLFPRSVNERFVIAWLVAIDLSIIAFLKLPMESGYLIPIIPFVILIFGKYLYNRAFVLFCLMLILSSFICTISPQNRFDSISPSKVSFGFNAAGEKLYFDVLNGPVMANKTRRVNGIDFVDKLLASTDTIKSKSVIVAGRWYIQMIVQCKDTNKLKATVRDYLTENEAVYYYAKGYVIYYLPKQDFYNKIMRKVDLEIYRASPYIKDPDGKGNI
jgi:hypothetical protein